MRNSKTTKWIIIVIAFLILLAAVFLLLLENGRSDIVIDDSDFQETNRVLLISSYSPSFKTFFQQIEGINSQFEGMDIVLDVEFMDSKRLYTDENINNFYSTLKYKIGSLPPYDLVLSADDNALNFVLEHQKELFNKTPVVFFGVNDIENATKASQNKYITGVVEAASISETIEIASKLNPDATNVVAIVDNTTSGQADFDLYYQQADSFKNLVFTELNRSMYCCDEYTRRLKLLDEDDIVLLLSLYCNRETPKADASNDGDCSKSNDRISFDEGLQCLLDHCSQPIYHPYYHGLGDGILGGKIISHYEQGRSAASIAMAILSGEPIPDDFLPAVDSNKYIFDYNILKEYGLNESVLPQETEFINRAPSIFDEYGNYILIVLIFIVFLIVVISVLSYTINRKNKAEDILEERNQELQLQKSKTNDILNLTARIGLRDDILNNKESFLSELLKVSLNVVDEADYGIAFAYEADTAIFTDVVGHNKQLIGLRIKGFLSKKVIQSVVRIKDGKQALLSNATGNDREALDRYLKPSAETMVIILSYNDEKIAGMALEKVDGYFSDESLVLANTLRSIPMAFFSQSAFYQEQHTMFESIIKAIVKILSLHNDYTKEHSMHVADIAAGIAKKLGLSKNEVEQVYWTGLVHDIGKILVPKTVLDKKEKLNDEEWELIKKHPIWGYETLVENKNLKEIAIFVLHHHERWDGNGYPNGVSGEDIPFASRILAVADAFGAMTNDRFYRKALTQETAVNEIISSSGKQFDPVIAKTFVENIDAIIRN